jgi:hypothetical protein
MTNGAASAGGIELEPSQQHQNQNDNKYEAEAATDIWTAAIEATAPDAAESAKQRDNQDNEQDGPN